MYSPSILEIPQLLCTINYGGGGGRYWAVRLLAQKKSYLTLSTSENL